MRRRLDRQKVDDIVEWLMVLLLCSEFNLLLWANVIVYRIVIGGRLVAMY